MAHGYTSYVLKDNIYFHNFIWIESHKDRTHTDCIIWVLLCHMNIMSTQLHFFSDHNWLGRCIISNRAEINRNYRTSRLM